MVIAELGLHPFHEAHIFQSPYCDAIFYRKQGFKISCHLGGIMKFQWIEMAFFIEFY